MRAKLEQAIAKWAAKQHNIFAGGIAQKRFARAWAEHEAGKSLACALYDNFNDRLLTALEKAAGVTVTYGGGSKDRGRPV